MEHPDFASMSDEELEEWRANTKGQLNELKEAYRASAVSHKERVERDRLNDLIVAAGLPAGTQIIVPTKELGVEGN